MERVFHVYNEARLIADERGGESSSTVYMDACIRSQIWSHGGSARRLLCTQMIVENSTSDNTLACLKCPASASRQPTCGDAEGIGGTELSQHCRCYITEVLELNEVSVSLISMHPHNFVRCLRRRFAFKRSQILWRRPKNARIPLQG